MHRVAVAAPSSVAAAAGAAVAEAGGNAVDAAVAASIVSTISEPGVCSLGAGGYLTIATPDGDTLVIDAVVATPGMGAEPGRQGEGLVEVTMEYGGGTTTLIGPGSVAVPGAVAGWAEAVSRFGVVPWHDILEPAINGAKVGYPLPAASHEYLTQGGMQIVGWDAASRATLTEVDGSLLEPGDNVVVPGLAASLQCLADEGASAFYTGDIGTVIADDVYEAGGMLTRQDLGSYRAMVRQSLSTTLDDWVVATVPPPGIGGAAVAAVLSLMGEGPASGWDAAATALFAEALASVFTFRSEHLDSADDTSEPVADLLLRSAGGLEALRSPSTVHVSAVDDNGFACAITMSAGYGSGMIAADTGIWLNNCLGELELNRVGVHAQAPGRRLLSNMAPSVARSGSGGVLAVGTPGADRITSALAMVLINVARLGLDLNEAIAHPRLHVEGWPDHSRVAHEPGLDVSKVTLPTRLVPELSMYFGGATAAMVGSDGDVAAAADPRRTGGTAIVAR